MSHSLTQDAQQEPKLKHEFVGMMFAVTIGEVGLQTAALVQAGRGHWVQFLPEYVHLFLATVVVATSWVGWTLSVAPGARKDVTSVFQWEFLVALLDVTLVIVYFILVRSVDFGSEKTASRIASPPTVAFRILFMFCLYLAWDVLTKIIIYCTQEKGKRDKYWLNNYGTRILPTLICVGLAWVIMRSVRTIDRPYFITADIALLSLVLLFRAGKDLISVLFPTKEDIPKPVPQADVALLSLVVLFHAGKDLVSALFLKKDEVPKPIAEEEHPRPKRKKLWAWVRTTLCCTGILLGILWTAGSLPLPLSKGTIDEIRKAPSISDTNDTPASQQPESHVSPKEDGEGSKR